MAAMIIFWGGKLVIMHYLYDEERVVWQTKTKIINDYKSDYPDELVLGTSMALAINPPVIESLSGKRVMNLSAGSAQMAYHYYALKRILSQRKDIKKVYLTTARLNEDDICYTPGGSFGERMLRWFTTAQEAKEMETLIPGTIEMYKDTRFMGSKYFYRDINLLRDFHLRDYFKESAHHIMARTLRANKGYFLFGPYGTEVEDSVPYYSFENILTNEGFPFDTNTRWSIHGETNDIGRFYASKIVALLEAHGIDYEFFFGPIPQARATNEAPRLAMDGLEIMLSEFSKDKVNDKILVLPDAFFWDTYHVNTFGSKVFNEYFVDYIINDQDPEGTYETVDFAW
ncbi:MAG TPA: hypothetical protein VIT68_05460 [Candidatus Gracilibacteria bacterium]